MRYRTALGLSALCIALGTAPVAAADAEGPSHVMSAQELCSAIWPFSQAQANPANFGTVCVRSGGVLDRLARAMPAFISNSLELKPGSSAQLPIGSVRLDPDDPMSDWSVPG